MSCYKIKVVTCITRIGKKFCSFRFVSAQKRLRGAILVGELARKKNTKSAEGVCIRDGKTEIGFPNERLDNNSWINDGFEIKMPVKRDLEECPPPLGPKSPKTHPTKGVCTNEKC